MDSVAELATKMRLRLLSYVVKGKIQTYTHYTL